MQKSTQIRLLYGLKRFALYMLVGIVLNLMPYPNFLFLAIISILIASIVLATADAFNLQDLSSMIQAPPVFNRIRIILLVSLVLIVAVIDIFFQPQGFGIAVYFFLEWFTAITATIVYFIYFCFQTENYRAYAYKRFAAFLFVGLFAAMIPIPPFMIIGVPTILMATVDTLSLPPSAANPFDIDPHPVFTRHYNRCLLTLVILFVVYITIMLMRSH